MSICLPVEHLPGWPPADRDSVDSLQGRAGVVVASTSHPATPPSHTDAGQSIKHLGRVAARKVFADQSLLFSLCRKVTPPTSHPANFSARVGGVTFWQSELITVSLWAGPNEYNPFDPQRGGPRQHPLSGLPAGRDPAGRHRLLAGGGIRRHWTNFSAVVVLAVLPTRSV